MTRKLLLGTALSALMLSGAMVQSSAAPMANIGSKPPMAAPAKPGASAAKADTEKKIDTSKKADTTNSASTAEQNQSGNARVVTAQKPDQWLASKLKGTAVVGANNKKIGSIGDILLDKSGKIGAYVVSFGGFLGMGAKEVAVAPSSFQVVSGNKGKPDKLRLAMNKKELQRAPKFEAYEPPKPAPTASGAAKMGGVKMGGGGLAHTH